MDTGRIMKIEKLQAELDKSPLRVATAHGEDHVARLQTGGEKVDLSAKQHPLLLERAKKDPIGGSGSLQCQGVRRLALRPVKFLHSSRCVHASRAACSASPCCALSPGPLPTPPSPPTGARADTHPSLMAFLSPLRLHFCLSVFFSTQITPSLAAGTLIFEACASSLLARRGHRRRGGSGFLGEVERLHLFLRCSPALWPATITSWPCRTNAELGAGERSSRAAPAREERGREEIFCRIDLESCHVIFALLSSKHSCASTPRRWPRAGHAHRLCARRVFGYMARN